MKYAITQINNVSNSFLAGDYDSREDAISALSRAAEYYAVAVGGDEDDAEMNGCAWLPETASKEDVAMAVLKRISESHGGLAKLVAA